MQEKVLAMRQRLYPEGDHPDIAMSIDNLAGTLGDLGKHQQARTSAESSDPPTHTAPTFPVQGREAQTPNANPNPNGLTR